MVAAGGEAGGAVARARLGAQVAAPRTRYLADRLTHGCNLAGLPGLSLPCGFSAAGLPIGLQLLGRPFDEETLLAVGAACERAGLCQARPFPDL